MKRLFFIAIFIHATYMFAQDADVTLKPSLKFGKPSDKELLLKVYQPDSTANAICLLNEGKTYFTYNNHFQLVTERTVRLKILKTQGTSYADVAIPYYYPEDETKERDRIENIEGYSYNMENGKRIETPLAKEHMSDERIDRYYRVLKFSLPSVKAGSVIEYRYTYHSDYIHLIDTWMMQMDIPVVYGKYEITIPYMFVFDMETRRKEYIDIKQKETNMRAARYAGGAGYADIASVPCQQYIFTSQNLPAIKEKEPFCWCPDDYKAQIIFNLKGTYDSNDKLVSRSDTWEDIDKHLLNVENYDFGQLLTFPNPLREEAKQAFSSDMNLQKRIITAFHVLRKNLAWDGTYRLYGKDFAKVLKEGSGSNSELNFILLSILKDYGLEAYPVVLNLRHGGMLPPTFPTLDKLDTFIVAVYDRENDKYFFLDSSMPYPSLNVLPLDLSVTRARILSPKMAENKKWVNLLEQSSNVVFIQSNATVEEGTIIGKRTVTLAGQKATEYRRKQEEKNNENGNDNSGTIAITNKKIHQTPDNFTQIKEETDFTIKISQTSQLLYINPMLFTHLTQNPFIQNERTLPIEFPYPYTFTISNSLKLPQGYEVEEMPKSQLLRTEDSQFVCKYLIERKGDTILLNYIFNLKSYQFPSEQYKQIQEIWTKIIKKNKELLVLKKL